MASRPKSILALEWQTGVLRAVEATAAGETVRIQRIFSREIEPTLAAAPPAELGAALGAWLRQAGFRCRHAAVAVHRQSVLIRDLTIPPSRNRGDISEMVRLQAANLLPVEEGKTELDFIEEGLDDTGLLRIRVAAGATEQLGRLRAVLTGAGLKVAALPLRPGLILSLLRSSPLAREPVLLAEIGADWCQVSLVREGRIVLSRDLQRGYLSGKPSVDAGGRLPSLFDEDRGEFLRQTMAPLSAELRATLNAFVAESKTDLPTRMVVTGELADHVDLQQTLAEALDVEVIPLNPWELVRAPQRVVDQAERSSAYVGVLALAAGSLGGQRSFDFANPALVTRRGRPVQPWQVLAGACAAALVAVVAVGMANLTEVDQRLASRKVALAKLKQENQASKTVDATLKHLAAWRESDPVPLEVLHDLTALLPDAQQAYAEQLVFESPVRLRISLRVTERSVWNELFARIGESPGLRIAAQPATARQDNVPDTREHPYPIRYTFYLDVIPPPAQPAGPAATRPGPATSRADAASKETP